MKVIVKKGSRVNSSRWTHGSCSKQFRVREMVSRSYVSLLDTANIYCPLLFAVLQD